MPRKKQPKPKPKPLKEDRARLVQYSTDDLPYLRKRITQLERQVRVKDIRYTRLQNKYRAFLRHFSKLLSWLGVGYETIERYYSRVPYINCEDIEKEVDQMMRTTDFERKYYED